MKEVRAALWNWKTTIIGAVLAGLLVLQESIQNELAWSDPAVWVAVAIAILGFVAKDADKSGVPLAILAAILFLPGCETLAIRGSVSYLDTATGAKGGLQIDDSGGGWWIRLPWSDSDSVPADGAVVLEGQLPTVDRNSGK